MIRKDSVLNAATWLALASSFATVAVGLQGFRQPSSPRTVAADKPVPVKDWQRLIDTRHLIGPPTASEIVVEFADFRCPACKAFRAELDRLRAEYPNDFAISYRYAPLPYHARAYPSARAAECAATQNKFAEYHKILFDHFAGLDTLSFVDLAREAGIVDTAAFGRCVNRAEPVSRIESDRRLAFDTLHIRGTPAFIVEGELYSPLPTHAQMTQLIEAKRREAGHSSTK